MQVQKLYHRCGHPVLVARRQVGNATEILFLDGERPFIDRKDGSKSPNIVRECPECSGFIKMEKLLSVKPEASKEKGPTGYMPARI
ncbi:MAG: hypothetical protein GX443_03480 [Deltaproteobacteria bacterium]|nr:hypothetical protein [Deltaproteobacteria bacterium]